MVYLRLSGRLLINIHTGNAEGAVGNYISLSKMYILRRLPDGKLDFFEEPVISGNMIKHWHAIETINILKSMNYSKICEYCSRYVMYRSPFNYDNEAKFIENCAIEDLHGFLAPEVGVRRESIVRFSFLVPVEDMSSKYAAIVHNRVGITKEGAIDENVMMVFKREYASGLYGFSCALDLSYVGKCQSDPDKVVLDKNDRKIRVKAAILALANILTGNFGASRTRAMPIVKVTELIGVISKKPIPNLTNGYYVDYIDENIARLKSFTAFGFINENDYKIFVIGDHIVKKFESAGITISKYKDVVNAMKDIAEVAEEWLE